MMTKIYNNSPTYVQSLYWHSYITLKHWSLPCVPIAIGIIISTYIKWSYMTSSLYKITWYTYNRQEITWKRENTKHLPELGCEQMPCLTSFDEASKLWVCWPRYVVNCQEPTSPPLTWLWPGCLLVRTLFGLSCDKHLQGWIPPVGIINMLHSLSQFQSHMLYI